MWARTPRPGGAKRRIFVWGGTVHCRSTGHCRRRADEGGRPYVFRFGNLRLFFPLNIVTARCVMPEFPAMSFYRRNLPHLQRDNKPHFITFVTKFRWTLPDNAREITLSSCLHDDQLKYALHVAVVMPDHVHVILTPLIDESRREVVSLIQIMGAIKGASAHLINKQLGRDGAVWQEESFDHVLRSSESLDAKIDYILQNPVRKGLVDDWRNYRWLWQKSA
jgi:REP element-mobilizing transposase RayT